MADVSAATHEFDLVLLGGGTGGYVAAIRATQLGLKAGVVEELILGGTCLHRGCIPTKAFLKSADVFDQVKSAAEFGVPTDPVKSDFGYHIILATEPSAEALDSRAKELTASLFNASLGPLLDEADITIAPSIGEWDPTQGVVALGTAAPAIETPAG